MPYRIPDSWIQARRSYDRAVFRFDPVPGTGKRNWSFGHYYRTANCLQERKLYGDLDHRTYGRGKRYPCNLPDSWDDRTKSRYYDKKSWKKNKKKKQWMKREDYMISFSPGDNRVQMDAVDSPKKFNLNVTKGTVKSEDYTRPAMNDSQTDDDNLRHDKGDGYMDMRSEQDYPNVGEIDENLKNPERDAGQPGIRKRIDPDTGLPLEGVTLLEIKVPEDETPVIVDDGKKHGPLLKWQFKRDERGRTGPKS